MNKAGMVAKGGCWYFVDNVFARSDETDWRIVDNIKFEFGMTAIQQWAY
jgi:hypothetical protein